MLSAIFYKRIFMQVSLIKIYFFRSGRVAKSSKIRNPQNSSHENTTEYVKSDDFHNGTARLESVSDMANVSSKPPHPVMSNSIADKSQMHPKSSAVDATAPLYNKLSAELHIDEEAIKSLRNGFIFKSLVRSFYLVCVSKKKFYSS